MIQQDANIDTDNQNSNNNNEVYRKYIVQNQTIISNLNIDDLNYLENDLDFSEKVSLLFLLTGHNRLNAEVILQKLIINWFSPQNQTTHLQHWAKELQINNPSGQNVWSNMLIEALTLIKANHILRKLGLNLNILYEKYLPNLLGVTGELIHPVVRSLYWMCEQLKPSATNQMIEKIHNDYEKTKNLPFTDRKYLEIFLLNWLSEKVIDVGEFITPPRKEHCNLKPILDCLYELGKINDDNSDVEKIREKLQNVEIKFNFTKDFILRKDKKKTKKNIGIDDDNNNTKVNGQQTQQFQLKENKTDQQDVGDCDDAEKYTINHNRAGFCLIINQQKFLYKTPESQILGARDGTEVDKNRLMKTFRSFGYNIIARDNLTKDEIFSLIEEITNKCSKYDSLIVSILSHGYDGHVYDYHSMPISIRDIELRMTSASLADKPKLLIIQACQANIPIKIDNKKNKPIGFLKKDSGGNSISTASGVSNVTGIDEDYRKVPLRGDFCVMKSTIYGFVAFRHTITGSWFIQTLCDKIDEYGERCHILEIFQKCCKEVSLKRGDKEQCMVPICEQNLRKNFYLPFQN